MLYRHGLFRVAVGASVACAGLAACTASPATVPHQRLVLPMSDAQANDRLAHPTVFDWSNRVVTPVKLAEQPVSAPRARHLMALSVASQTSGNGFGNSAANGHVSSPAFDATNRRIFWVAENGWLLRRDLATNHDDAFPISDVDGPTPSDTFPHTEVTLSKDGQRVYLCSASGKFFALDAATGKNLVNSPCAMGGTDPSIGFMPAPYVDELAGTPDGAVESVYAMTNLGTLFRFYVDGTNMGTPPFILKAETTQIAGVEAVGGTAMTPLASERIRCSPVVVRGMLFTYGYFPGVLPAGWPIVEARILAYDTLVRSATIAPMGGHFPPSDGSSPNGAGNSIGPDMRPPTIILDSSSRPAFLVTPFLATVRAYALEGDEAGQMGGVPTTYITNAMPATGRAFSSLPTKTLPAIQCPSAVTYDPVHSRLYATDCNALLQIPFGTELHTLFPNDYVDDDIARLMAMSAPIGVTELRGYAKTTLGVSAGSEDGAGNSICNLCPPVMAGSDVYVLDNFAQPDASTRVTLNHFTVSAGQPPNLVEAIDLSALAPNLAAVGTPGIAYDPIGTALYLSTTTTSGPAASGLWALGL